MFKHINYGQSLPATSVHRFEVPKQYKIKVQSHKKTKHFTIHQPNTEHTPHFKHQDDIFPGKRRSDQIAHAMRWGPACLKQLWWNARMSPHWRLEQCHYWTVEVLVAKWRSCKAEHLWWASSWWQWRDGSNCPGCTRSSAAACAVRVGCPGWYVRGREEDVVAALHL